MLSQATGDQDYLIMHTSGPYLTWFTQKAHVSAPKSGLIAYFHLPLLLLSELPTLDRVVLYSSGCPQLAL